MIFTEFQIQMNRLIGTYGKANYNEDRSSLIFQEVKDFDLPWFKKLVDKFIGENKFAPLVPEFREACIDERETSWSKEKIRNEKTAKDFMHRVFSDEDQSVLFKSINNRIAGKMNDIDFGQMLSSLDKITKFEAQPPACKKCDDVKLVTFFDGKFENRRSCTC